MAGITKEERARRAEQAKASEQANQQTYQGGESQASDATQQDGQQGGESSPGGDGGDPDPDPELKTQAGAEGEQKTGKEEGKSEETKKPDLVTMYRDEPEHPGHPTTAEVHPDQVESWKEHGWKVEE